MKKTLLPLILLLLIGFIAQAQTPVSITEARETNADGTLVLEGQSVEVNGISIGPNFRPDGLTFVLFDEANNVGITIFNNMGDAGYTVADGDELTITGEVDQFAGLAEIIPSSITVVSSGNSIPSPEVVSNLGEETESKLITVHNLTLVDAGQWDVSGGGSFNVDVTNGTNMMQIRVDSDTNVPGLPAPSGPFSATGIGGQYDLDAPHDVGYQLFPRNVDDIVEGSVSTKEIYNGSIKLFPNPANELITIEADDAINRVSFYNMLGELVLVNESTNNISVADLSNGTYFVKVALNDAVWNQKLSIVK